jgi:hypothetical protein
MCSTKPHISDPAVTAWIVVEFSRELGFQNIIMEGDALEIVHALQKEGCYWTYRQLVEDANLLERISGHGWWGT